MFDVDLFVVGLVTDLVRFECFEVGFYVEFGVFWWGDRVVGGDLYWGG